MEKIALSWSRAPQVALACHPLLIVARHFLDGGVVEALAMLGRGLAGIGADAAVRESAARKTHKAKCGRAHSPMDR